MIHLIKSKDVANVISTTTNGSLLSKQYVEDLVKSGLDLIRISVEHVNSEGYKKITSTFSDYEQIVANVRNLYDAKKRSASKLYIQVKITNSGMSKQQIENFYNEFKSISDEVRVDTLMGWSLSEKKDFTLGNNVATGMDGISELKDRLICPEPFSKLAINSDGNVSVCCVDWSHGAIVGDVRTHSLDEIWNGELLNHIRVSHIRGERSNIGPCAQCQYVLGVRSQEDLDKYKDELLKIYCK
jgi:radical SAM protein with 4Fe4S-binding SPASM domain